MPKKGWGREKKMYVKQSRKHQKKNYQQSNLIGILAGRWKVLGEWPPTTKGIQYNERCE